MKRLPALALACVLLLALLLSACGADGESAAAGTESVPEDTVTLLWPEEASSTLLSRLKVGVDATWNWKGKSLHEKQVPSLFGQNETLRFSGYAIESLDSLTADGLFDTEGVAQNMTVQGWSGVRGDLPLFSIYMFRLDSRLLPTAGNEPEHVSKQTVYGVPVELCWLETEKGTVYYCARFEAKGLGLVCQTTATAERTEEEARELMDRIVSHCINHDANLNVQTTVLTDISFVLSLLFGS